MKCPTCGRDLSSLKAAQERYEARNREARNRARREARVRKKGAKP